MKIILTVFGALLIGLALTTVAYSEAFDYDDVSAIDAGLFPESQRAAIILGKPVLSADDETVGHVNDIIFSEDGVLMGYIVNVGGFIGIDTTQVYVPIDQTRLRIDGSSVEMFLDLSAAELSIVTESR